MNDAKPPRELSLISLQVGLPRTLGQPDAAEPMDREWTSGIHKLPVSGPVAAGATGLAGDGQADLKNHGGPDKAINAYPADHFAYWREELRLTFAPGSFGENFTTLGATEDEVCVGDIYRVGSLVVQISQPRQPCWKLARRWRITDLAARVERTGRTGWYFRVVEPGMVHAPDILHLVERPHPEWTITAANEVMYRKNNDTAAARALASCTALSESWRTHLAGRAARAPVEEGS
jgi:MOSC domain-containing protein YiiM